MVTKQEAALISTLAGVYKVIGNEISKVTVELKWNGIDIYLPDGKETLSYELMEPLVEYFVKNNVNWKIVAVGYTSGSKGFKLNIWK